MFFRETKIGYYVGCIVGGVCVLNLGRLIFPSEIYAWISCAVWLFLCIATLNSIDKKKMKKAEQLLLNDCDPNGFVELFETLATRRLRGNARNYVYSQLANGYRVLGQDAQCLAALEKVGKIPNNRNKLAYQFVCKRNLFTCHLRESGNIEAAEDALSEMKRLLDNPEWKEKHKKEYFDVFEESRQLLRMTKGEYDGCKEFFARAAENAKNAWAEVRAKFYLGEISLHENSLEEAEKFFRYVAMHGGTTSLQKQAIERLESIGKTIEVPYVPKEPAVFFERKEKQKLYSALAALVLVSVVLTVFVIPWVYRIRQFSPTMQEAFSEYLDKRQSAERPFGEVLFIDEHNDILAVLHKAKVEKNTYSREVAFFLTEEYFGEKLYYCLISRPVYEFVDFSQPNVSEQFCDIVTGYTYASLDYMDSNFGRRPLFGLANDSIIWLLSINGQPVDYVKDIGVWQGEGRVFFWYFADAEVLYVEDPQAENVHISFD